MNSRVKSLELQLQRKNELVSLMMDSFNPLVVNGHFWFKTARRKHPTSRDPEATSNTGGTVTCYLKLEGDETFQGRASCSSEDTFDGKFARTLALFRARVSAQNTLYGDPDFARSVLEYNNRKVSKKVEKSSRLDKLKRYVAQAPRGLGVFALDIRR